MFDVAKKKYLSARGRPAPTQTMRGHKEEVNAVAFFKDSRRIVTGSLDGTLRIWDVQQGAIGGPFEGHNRCVQSVAVSPNERRLASGGFDGKIIIWDVESKQQVFSLVEHTYDVTSLCFSPNGKRLASGSKDKTVILWDAETGAVLATLYGHRNFVLSVAFSPDGLKLASGSADYTIRVWRTDKAELLLDIRAHENRVKSVVWSPDGQQVVSASDDRTVKFWNSTNGDQIGRPCTGHTDSIYSLAISSDGSFIATASQDKTVRLWSTTTHQQIGQALGHPTEVWCVAISSIGELLVSGGRDGNARLWFIKNILKQHHAKEKMKEEMKEEMKKNHNDHFFSVTCSNPQLPVRGNSPGNGPSETHKVPDSHDKHQASDILTEKNSLVRAACIAGDLHTAEYLLHQEIDADDYANRSVVRARNSEWDNALEDAKKSIAIQPSMLGYISKGISLCGNHKLWDAMEAFDLASTFANRDPITIDVLLLIKAVALFNANCHGEAVRRVRDLAAANKNSDELLCSVVNSYLRVQLATNALQDGRYIEAADGLSNSIPSILNLLSRRTLFEPRFKIFTLLFGWDMDLLWQTVNQRLCEAYLRADRVVEAAKAYRYMMRMIDEGAVTSCIEWSTAFKKECTARCLSKGDEAFAASNHDIAIELYSAGIGIDFSCEPLFVQRSKARLAQYMYAEALQDAEKVIELNPSSYLGYELQHAALHGARRYDEAIEVFEMMLLKLEDATDPQIRKLRRQYLSPSKVQDIILRAVDAHLEIAPLRVLNTSTGRLCDQQAQINVFVKSTEYKELLSSSMKHPHLQSQPIKETIVKYFQWVMLSHRWENNEPPLLHVIQDQVVYDLGPVGPMVKLQKFCKTARNAGYRWAWSDTCCIDQNNHVEREQSVNSMFVWYRHSALTIVYLSDVSPSAKSGALAHSVWNTRGWTVQEFLAPKVVLFYQKDWTLYLDDRSPNHKESVTIMQELEDSTGIDSQTLIAFRPGMSGARQKLQWASTRRTTLQEDVAYSLFGIFGVHLSVIYGETKQNALGRLLEAIVAQSGDITALDWVGKASEFNSCLPAEITSYKSPPCIPSSLSEDQLQTSVSSLRHIIAVDLASTLYARLDNMSAPRFANRRLQLPCIAFVVREVRQRRGQDQETCFTYEAKADGLQDLLITTEDKLVQFSPARPTPQAFLLIRPRNRHDVGLPDFADDAKSTVTWSEPLSYLDEALGGHPGENEPVDSESHSRALGLIVRLGQPFGALLLAQQRGGEFKRIASDHNIIAQVKDTAAVHDMMDIRTLEIL